MSEAREAFVSLKENRDFGTKLREAAQKVVSAWMEHKQKNYNQRALEIIK